ncbi:Non-ribosomal peptide synthetase [Actinokineospora spheciospongiae]|uniref:Non-ribosomal peptide synthetase n=1 Tax=Actinokineospora spheciospongiae TaxID=909613 RepID=W7J629_9PSEU|nr:Non-ribosomal peptide synthetase [Actinokineospora spheciospongiae]
MALCTRDEATALTDLAGAVGVDLPTAVFGLLILLVARWDRLDEVTIAWGGAVTTAVDLDLDLSAFLTAVGTSASAVGERGVPDHRPAVAYTFDDVRSLMRDAVLDGCQVSLEEVVPGALDVDVAFAIRQCGSGLELLAHHRGDRVGVESFVESFGHLVRVACRGGRTPVGQLGIVSDRQAAVLRRIADGGPPTTGSAATVLDAVRRHAAEQPDCVAVRHDGRAHTYRDVLAVAEAIAADLAALGVGPGSRTLLLSSQGPEAISAVLATAAVGAAYVPLDVEAPVERLAAITAGAGASVLIVGAGAHHAHDLADGSIPVLDIGAGRPRGSAARPTARSANPDDPAYVIFTSGSTGTPKGVVVGQRALAHFAHEIVAAYKMAPGDRVLAFARPSFDVSVFEVLATLYAGATVCVATVEQRRDPMLLRDFMRGERVTVAELPPALMPQLRGDYPDLRLVSVGGEAFPGSLVEEWARDGREFWNGYGPTETTVAVTLMRCDGRWSTPPPIGRPLPGLRTHVLDDRGQLQPPMALGELCVAGPSLADGYLDRPDSGFCFVDAVGERVYRTGDLARWRPDGNLQFHGRNDRQVQINGFRVEPSDVEQGLGGAEGVAAVRVELFDHPSIGRVLTAFVVPVPGRTAPTTAALRRHARTRLPEYAVPRRFVALPEIPLTAHGKVDRHALERLLVEHDRPDASHIRHDLSPTEHLLAVELVGPVLGTPAPDPEAGFFELGGNSLQATQVLGGIREVFGVRLSVTDFFQNPTIRSLAVRIDHALPLAPGRTRPDHQETAAESGQTFPTIAFQEEVLEIARDRPYTRSAGLHQVFTLTGQVDPTRLRNAWTALQQRHDALRTTFVEVGGRWRQRVGTRTSDLAIRSGVVDARTAVEAVDRHRAAGFKLADGPLAHAELIVGAGDAHVLVLSWHHIVVDGYSLGVLWDDLCRLYDTAAAGPAPIQQSDFAVRQAVSRRARAVEVADAIRSRHFEALGGAAAPPRPASADLGAVTLRWSREERESLVRGADEQGLTLHMLLLASYRCAVEEYGLLAQHAPVWTPMSGRLSGSWGRSVGIFMNLVPVFGSVEHSPDGGASVGALRSGCIDALDRQDVPRNDLVELVPELPRATALFALQNSSPGTAELVGTRRSVPESPGLPAAAPILEFDSPVDSLFLTALSVESSADGGLVGVFEHDRARVDPATAAEAATRVRDRAAKMATGWFRDA